MLTENEQWVNEVQRVQWKNITIRLNMKQLNYNKIQNMNECIINTIY